MSENVIVFPHEKLRNYLLQALDGFAKDPADSPHQEGYQDALEEIYRVFFDEQRK